MKKTLVWASPPPHLSKIELQQLEKVRFSEGGGLPQKSVFFSSHCSRFYYKKLNILEECRKNLKEFRTTLRTSRTTWNNLEQPAEV